METTKSGKHWPTLTCQTLKYLNLFFDTVDGTWGAWSLFGDCSDGYGYGTQMRIRFCNNPAPANAGLECDGNDHEDQYCFNLYSNGMMLFCFHFSVSV